MDNDLFNKPSSVFNMNEMELKPNNHLGLVVARSKRSFYGYIPRDATVWRKEMYWHAAIQIACSFHPLLSWKGQTRQKSVRTLCHQR